jgi:parallel beta-helix repeat protein
MSPPGALSRCLGIAVILAAAWMLPLLLQPPAAAAGTSQPDWVVSTPTTLDQTVKDLKANLIIESGGELRISNSTLVMNCSTEGEFEIIVKSGGRLVAERANITFGPSRAHYWFRVNGSMELRDCELSGTRGMFDLGGIYITSSQVTIANCHLYDHQWYAIIINGSSPAVSGCQIDTGKSGIRIDGGARPAITGNTIKNNERDGITVLGSNPTIRDNKIINNWRGIGLYQSEPELSGNEITGSGLVGIDCSDNSDAAITGNMISGSGQAGISVLYSAPRIKSNTITSNGVGINTSASAAVIEKNTIAANREWGIYAKGGAPVVEGNIYTDGSGRGNGLGALASVWTLSVKVVDSEKKAVPDATVTVKDRTGKLVFSGTTRDDGTVPALELFQAQSSDSGSPQSTTPHTIGVKWEELSSTTTVKMNKDQYITAELTRPAPNGFIPGAGLALTAIAMCLSMLVIRRNRGQNGP